MQVLFGYLNVPFFTQCSATFCFLPAFFLEVVQKLIDWGADVNQLRFDTDVSSHAALNCGRVGAGRSGE